MGGIASESRAGIRFRVEPRLVPPAKAARRLHLTASEFTKKAADLYRVGFPPPCPVTGYFDLVAIDVWQDRRSGLIAANDNSARVSTDSLRKRLEAIG